MPKQTVLRNLKKTEIMEGTKENFKTTLKYIREQIMFIEKKKNMLREKNSTGTQKSSRDKKYDSQQKKFNRRFKIKLRKPSGKENKAKQNDKNTDQIKE